MSTNNMSDEELDNLFRKSAESFDPPYDPEAWIVMEEKLDRVGSTRPWWYKLLYPLLILILLGSAITIYKLAQESSHSPVKVKNLKYKGSIEEKDQTAYHNVRKKTNELFKSSKQNLTGIKASTNATLDPVKENETKHKLTQVKTISVTDRKNYHASEIMHVTGLSEASATDQKVSVAKWNKLSENVSGKKIKAVSIPDAKATLGIDTSGIIPKSEEEFKAQNDSSKSQTINSNKHSALLSRLNFSVVVAPDMTSVKFRNTDAISANAGLLVGFPVTKRISIVTGIIWSNKVYEATSDDYNPSADYWNSRKLPSSINATCSVLDIPVNIKYKILDREKYGIAIQAGLSSYLMLNEKYVYNYTSGYSPYRKTQEIANQNRHWFEVQNISINYSRKLSPVLSVGVEPFAKIPLSGIGTGKVKLTSAGVFLTAEYTLQLSK